METRASFINDLTFEEIIEKYKNTVFAIAMTRVHNRSDADDIFQEVFLAYFRVKPEFNEEEHRKAWLIRTALNFSRRRKKKTVSFAEATDAEQADTEEHFSFKLEQQELIWNALRQLPDKYREVVYLFYFEDMTTEQTADALQIRPNTVRTRLTRAREMLRVALKEDFFNE